MTPGARRFLQVDVFGETPGRGNPVAVVVDAEGLADEELQAFATWTNLSETTFLLPATTPGADYRVRIFTPSRELPFAGHPTLGSAHAFLEAGGDTGLDALVQECGAGLVPLRRIDGRLAFAAPPLTRSGPLDDETLAGVVGSLGIAPDEVVDHAWCVNGPTWATVLLSSAERVLELRPQPGPVQDIGVVGLHPDGTPELRAIVLDPHFVEDPVTGSLNAGVAQWLTASGRLQTPYVARQGTAIDRAGRIHVSAADDQLWIGGATATVIDGTVRW